MNRVESEHTKNISKDVITNHHANWKEEPAKVSEEKNNYYHFTSY